jgi:DNA-directed RNA polymerase specialized sigma subunit
MLELLQESNLGLMNAIRTFSGSSEAFAGHAAASIENTISKAMDELPPSSV